MKPLETRFTCKGFEYMQEWRDDNFAIYSQWMLESADKKEKNILVGYESIKITKNKSGERFGRIFEASESYPSGREWGINGFTSKSFTEAEKILLKHFPKIQNLSAPKSVEARTLPEAYLTTTQTILIKSEA